MNILITFNTLVYVITSTQKPKRRFKFQRVFNWMRLIDLNDIDRNNIRLDSKKYNTIQRFQNYSDLYLLRQFSVFESRMGNYCQHMVELAHSFLVNDFSSIAS